MEGHNRKEEWERAMQGDQHVQGIFFVLPHDVVNI